MFFAVWFLTAKADRHLWLFCVEPDICHITCRIDVVGGSDKVGLVGHSHPPFGWWFQEDGIHMPTCSHWLCASLERHKLHPDWLNGSIRRWLQWTQERQASTSIQHSKSWLNRIPRQICLRLTSNCTGVWYMMIWYQNRVSHAFAFGSAYHPADDNDKQLGQLPIANEPWVNRTYSFQLLMLSWVKWSFIQIIFEILEVGKS